MLRIGNVQSGAKVYMLKAGDACADISHSPVCSLSARVATRPGFPGMSRICTMLSRVPARPSPDAKCPGFQGAAKTHNDNNNINNNNNNYRYDSSNLI